MSRIYCPTNRIRFTDISEKYAIPRSYKGKQCEVHSALISYVCMHYRDTKKYRQTVVDALNRLTYCIMQGELPSFKWMSDDPLNTMPDIDLDLVEEALNGFYLTPDAIEWDITPVETLDKEDSDTDYHVTKQLTSSVSTSSTSPSTLRSIESKQAASSQLNDTNGIINKPLRQIKEQQRSESIDHRHILTPKSDLYIQPPCCLRFDVTKVWLSRNINGDDLVIYTTLPEIPHTQNDISVTTDPSKMTDSEFMNLYPNHIVHTRSQNMYFKYDGLDYDEDLGCIIPVEGFTTEQIIKNMIKYPHLFRIKKMTEQGPQPFFHTIELNGELVPILDAWDSIPESKVIPKDSEFIKEYVIRRYLLEEEEIGIRHKYRIDGGLEPFLTLFMPPAKYIERGFTDPLSIVKQCVTSRIHYKQARNPILRRIERSV